MFVNQHNYQKYKKKKKKLFWLQFKIHKLYWKDGIWNS